MKKNIMKLSGLFAIAMFTLTSLKAYEVQPATQCTDGKAALCVNNPNGGKYCQDQHLPDFVGNCGGTETAPVPEVLP